MINNSNYDPIKTAQNSVKSTLFQFITSIFWIIVWTVFLVSYILIRPEQILWIVMCCLFLVFNIVFTFKYWNNYKKRKNNYLKLMELENKLTDSCPYFIDNDG